jgi:DNA polymerase elongation subunit (family B)
MLLKVKTQMNNDETYLQLTKVGGEMRDVKRPFDPYFFCPYKPTYGEHEALEKILLSTLKRTPLFKVSFPNTKMLKNLRVPSAIEAEMPYDQRVAVDIGFKTASGALSHDAFDLEMESTHGFFPNALKDRITAISYEGENFAQCKTVHDEPEYEIIGWFTDLIKRRNPDLLDTFFGSFADWDWLIKRADANGIPLSVGRDGSPPFVKIRTFKTGKKIGEDRIIELEGRVHFDVWKEVEQDQTLFGIKNHQLKTVAQWFGIPVIKVDRASMKDLTPEQLRAYCQSDAHATHQLAKIYIRNLIPLTEQLAIAFNMAVDRSPSHVSNYIYMREFRKLDIVADKNNSERYPEFYQEGKSSYQGALINLFAPGKHEKIMHVDFRSMYPGNMICFNYSPETLLWTKINHDGRMKEWVEIHGDEISVYDKYLGVITVKVDLKHEGVSKRVLKDFTRQRRELKRKVKKVEDAADINSQQWAIKVIMNAIPGYNGMGYARCGSFPIAAHITGEGRWEITHATDFLFKEHATPIERDTDGIYYLGEDYAKEITELIRAIIPEIYERDAIELETNTYDAGIFYDEKGYILRNGQKLTFHGSGLKGRHLPKICDWALEKITWGIFKEDDIIGILNNLGAEIKKQSSIEDFLMTIKLSKEPERYSEDNQYGKLIEKAKKAGLNVFWGSEFQYLKTKEYGFMPYGALWNRSFKIDYEYYRDRIASVLVRPLKVTHGYIHKTILWALKGGRIF